MHIREKKRNTPDFSNVRFVHHVVKKGDFQEKLPVASIDFESTVCGENVLYVDN